MTHPRYPFAEAYIYSGRPNPKWVLTDAQMNSWKKQWDHAEPSEVSVSRPSILGYTGCLLQNDQHSYWIIFNGCVSFYDKGNNTNKKDLDRRLEKWLIHTGPSALINECFPVNG